MKPRDIPNLLSVLRIILIVPVVWLLLDGAYGWALLVFAVAGFTDGLDGYLAARYGWRSPLGGILDPLADKVLLVSSFITLALVGLAPWWLVVLVLARDVVIVAGALAYHFLIGGFAAAPTILSKINTVVQILFVLFIVADAAQPFLGVTGRQVLWLVTGLTTLVSGAHYVVSWSRKALANRF